MILEVPAQEPRPQENNNLEQGVTKTPPVQNVVTGSADIPSAPAQDAQARHDVSVLAEAARAQTAIGRKRDGEGRNACRQDKEDRWDRWRRRWGAIFQGADVQWCECNFLKYVCHKQSCLIVDVCLSED